MHLIHECMGLPASPPVTSEDSEVDGDSPPSSRSTVAVVPVPVQTFEPPPSTVLPQQEQIPIQMPPQQDQSMFNPQLIAIDERTLQLHFTPLYFGKKPIGLLTYSYPSSRPLDLLDAMANMKNNHEYVQLTNNGLF